MSPLTSYGGENRTYLGRLADFLTDHLPLVCVVLLDRVAKFDRLPSLVNATRSKRRAEAMLIPRPRRTQRNAYPKAQGVSAAVFVVNWT